ncbi:hypothetical protein, partial [Acinetobacter baumannii]|uniref:hypothetical protein n=1 Tax=Acinetobacter baumannii TaxID=470 RepID=UPI001C087152
LISCHEGKRVNVWICFFGQYAKYNCVVVCYYVVSIIWEYVCEGLGGPFVVVFCNVFAHAFSALLI